MTEYTISPSQVEPEWNRGLVLTNDKPWQLRLNKGYNNMLLHQEDMDMLVQYIAKIKLNNLLHEQ